MSPDEEKDCLAYDPFAGDDGDLTVFSDKMAVARKRGPCVICRGEIQPGERVRALRERFDGQVKTFRFCALCCEAMAKSWDDAGEAIEERTRMGMADVAAREQA
jgi:hypothetical protein